MEKRLQPANFVTKTFSGCCTTRATAHILGCSLSEAGIQSCITINKKDDNWRAILKNAQRALSEFMLGKDEAAASKKRKQAVMD